MLKLSLTMIAIALPDCINPTLIGGELLVATGSRPRHRTAVFTLAAWTVTFVFGLALALGLGDLILSLVPKPSPAVKYALIAAAGAVLLLGGASIWIRRRTLTKTQRDEPPRQSHGSPAVLGAGIAGVELLTAFPYFAAIAIIIGAGVSNANKVFLIALYCVVYALPLIAIAAVFAILGRRGEAAMRPIGDWLSAHWPAVVAPLTAAFGAGLLAFGIAQLATG